MEALESLANRVRHGLFATALSVAVIASPSHAAPDSRPVVKADSRAVHSIARGLGIGAGLRIENLAMEGDSSPAVLDLKRVEVFAPDAEIVAYTSSGQIRLPLPDNVYLRGFVGSDLSSTAVVTISPKGRARGIITSARGAWTLHSRKHGIRTRKVDKEQAAAGRGFRCGSSSLDRRPVAAEAGPAQTGAAAAPAVGYTARIAVDTDFEFFSLPPFGRSTTAATKYVGDLFAYVSAVFEAEVGTGLVVGSLKLRTTSADPWTFVDTETAILQVTDYWRANYSAVSRSTTHFLSGKPLGGGIAWLGGLCDSQYGYGVSGDIEADFRPGSPSMVWDALVVTHEIGHNFNSEHTHCYGNIGGNSKPVDKCFGLEVGDGCYSGAPTLPCATPGAGCGTIMSYCHTLPGAVSGLDNMSMTFGLNHPHGVAPGRVPVVMANFAAARAAAVPGCLALPLGAPTGVAATDGTLSSKVRVTWNSVAGATGYKIFRSTSNSTAAASLIGPGTSPPYDDTTATAGTTYWYWVKASSAGGDSTFSAGDSGFKATVASGPDFVVTSVTLNPGTPMIGVPFSATVVVKNQGTVSGDGGSLAAWANQGSSQSCGATGSKSAAVGTLAAGASKTLTLTGLSTSSVGTKTFRAFVDSACGVTETIESNNQFTQSYTAGGASGTDFVVTDVTLTPSTPTANGTFSATVTVKNQGGASSDGGTLAVWTNRAGSQSCGTSGARSATVGTLAAGASKTLTFSGLSSGTAGTKTLRAFVDSGCAATETNESNNQLSRSYTVGGTSGPDFVVTGVSLNPTNPTVGATFTATVTVKNQGGASGDGGSLDVWANQGNTQSCGATGRQTKAVGPLAVGAAATLTFSGLGTSSAGAKTFRAFVDSGCATAETNESDNQFALGYTAQSGLPVIGDGPR